MNGSRHAVKVGAFVLLGLVVLATMILLFNKGGGWWTRTYELNLRAKSLNGLQQGSVVLMSGVHIGEVEGAHFGPEGKGVIIKLQIREKFKIHGDARFVIEQLGFLGDQFVSIYPQTNVAPVLKNGDMVVVEEPFNLQETVRSASELLNEIKTTAQALNEMAARVNRTVLSEGALTNGTAMIANLRETSQRARSVVEGVDQLVKSNAPPISATVSNLAHFSQEVQGMTADLKKTIATSSAELTKTMQSLEKTAQSLEGVAVSLQSGEGAAGALLKNKKLKDSLARTLSNLEVATSNISNYGLLYKPKKPKKNVATLAVPPKNPFE